MKIQKPFRISPSSISLFKRCPLNFKWACIDEVEVEENSGNYYAVLGSAFHKAMELNDIFNIDPIEIKKFFKLLFYTYLTDANIDYKNDDNKYKNFISRGYELIDNGLNLKKRWKYDNDVFFNEKYFRIKFENKYIDEMSISGKIDLALKNKKDDIYTILDWKTSKKTDDEIHTNVQLTIYIHYIHKTLNVPYENIYGALAYPSLNEIIFTQRNKEQVDDLFDELNIMAKKIYKNDFKRNKSESSCFFCPFKMKCSNESNE